jgi:hypothetical protein
MYRQGTPQFLAVTEIQATLRPVGRVLVRYERVPGARAAVADSPGDPEGVLDHHRLGSAADFWLRRGQFHGKAGQAQGIGEVLENRLRYALGKRFLVTCGERPLAVNGSVSRRPY